eukprot:COSAG02_NODE_88_length_38629_cov_457.967999_11_plen_218_part_00
MFSSPAVSVYVFWSLMLPVELRVSKFIAASASQTYSASLPRLVLEPSISEGEAVVVRDGRTAEVTQPVHAQVIPQLLHRGVEVGHGVAEFELQRVRLVGSTAHDSAAEQYASVMNGLIADCSRLEDRVAELENRLQAAVQERDAAAAPPTRLWPSSGNFQMSSSTSISSIHLLRCDGARIFDPRHTCNQMMIRHKLIHGSLSGFNARGKDAAVRVTP